MRSPALRRLSVALAAALALGLMAGCGREGPVVFTHGVASGDVRTDSAVLWTRVDRGATLTVEIAGEPTFADVTLEQDVAADREHDFTVKAEVSGLEPGSAYYYRFRRGESVSDVGAFRTAPAEDEEAPVRFVFSGDSDGTVAEDGSRAFDFQVLGMARGDEPDFFVYLGDIIYADSGFGPKAETLEAYRAKYKENREIEPLLDLLAATSVYAIWDDHEVENDFAGTTVDPDLLAAGRQAFREYLPLAGDDRPEVLYRRFRWGKAVELIILDERSFRDDSVAAACIAPGADQPDLLPGLGLPGVVDAYRDFRGSVGLPADTDPGCAAALNDPDRTMLGEEQKEFLLDALGESDATFKFIINEVPIAGFGALPYDRWEGYRAEREEILRFIEEQQIPNVIFLTTDLHANMISDVRVELDSPPVAVEAITGPIGHATLGDDIAVAQGEEAIGEFETLLAVVGRASCVDLDSFSYGLVEVDPDSGTATITLKDEDGWELCQTVIEAE